jgi:putative chitinase
MTYEITEAQFSAFATGIKDPSQISSFVQAINTTLDRFNISDSVTRVQYFITQAAFESSHFTDLVEDLYYSTAERLVEVWPSRFTLDPTHTQYALATNYTANPEALGNFIYANRNGNGDVASGDGYNFRGRGLFEITGRANYSAAGLALYGDDSTYLNTPDIVAQPLDAALTSGWFWDSHNFNALADANSFTAMTGVINGSTVTAPQRLQLLAVVQNIFTWN